MAAFNLDDFDIVKADTLKEPHSITIYGPPGKGKTVFAASISEVEGYERTIILDTEGGAVSVGAWYPQADVLQCPSAAKFQAAFEALMNGKLVERESGLPYQAVIIDTIDKAFARQLDVFDKSPDAIGQNGKKDARFKWGAIKAWMEKISDAAHQAPFLTIFVVHAEDFKNEDTGATTTTVMLGGASRFNFPSVSDAVGYFNVVKVKDDSGKLVPRRSVDFRVDTKFVTKQRFADKLNGVFIDPDMKRIFDKIRN